MVGFMVGDYIGTGWRLQFDAVPPIPLNGDSRATGPYPRRAGGRESHDGQMESA